MRSKMIKKESPIDQAFVHIQNAQLTRRTAHYMKIRTHIRKEEARRDWAPQLEKHVHPEVVGCEFQAIVQTYRLPAVCM